MPSPLPSSLDPRRWRKPKKRYKPIDKEEQADIIFQSNCFSDAKHGTDNPNPHGDNWMDERNLQLQKAKDLGANYKLLGIICIPGVGHSGFSCEANCPSAESSSQVMPGFNTKPTRAQQVTNDSRGQPR